MNHLALHLTGRIEAKLDERDITREFRTEKERALLAFLMVESDRAHWRDGLAELFWPDRPSGVARTNLRQALSGIRRALKDASNTPPFILADDETIQFNPQSSYWLDVVAFQGLIQAVMTHQHKSTETCQVCARRLEEAVALYRGEFMEGFYLDDSQRGQEWIAFQREQLYTRMLTGMQTLMSHFTWLGDHEQALKYALDFASLAPYEESAHRALMQIYLTIGRRSAALEQYHTCRRVLKEELGVDPSPETIKLYEQIKAGTSAGSISPVTQPLAVQIPMPITSFVGRANELEWFERCLANPTCRLITLTGMPGVGKSRLAMEAATRAQRLFGDGVKFFRMDEVTNSEALPRYLARGLGQDIPSGSDPQQVLVNYLNQMHTLLVLDGFERLVDATDMLLELLRSAEDIKILVTTRRRLNYQSVCLTELGGLQYPPHEKVTNPEQFPAVQLFLSRASRSQLDYKLNGEELTQLVRVCRLVDGLPLGLEMAAAALRDYSLKQIADRLEKAPASLSVGLMDVPDRQRSLWSLFEDAWLRLEDDDQASLARLSVFESGFDTEAAEAVTGVDQARLSSLTDQSLVRRPTAYSYGLHPLVKQYARYQLELKPEVSDQILEKHSSYYLDFLRLHHAALIDCQETAVDELRAVMADLYKALAWANEHGRSQVVNEGQAILKRYFQSCMLIKEKECAFWKVELALNQDQPVLIDLPVLNQRLTRESWCCGRLGCLEESDTAFILEDENHSIVEVNFQASQLLGFTRGELQGTSVADWAPGLMEAESPEVTIPVDVMRPDGQIMNLTVTRSQLDVGDERIYLVILQVRGDSGRLVDGSTVAGYDPLTSLPNRDWFRNAILQSLGRASRERRSFTMFLVEMHGVRTVNELFGKEYGDAAMLESASRLKRRTRAGDTVARLGAHSFALLLDGVEQADVAERVADKLLAALTEPFDIGGHALNFSAHIGIVIAPLGGDSVDDVLKHADDALKQSFARGESAYQVYRYI